MSHHKEVMDQISKALSEQVDELWKVVQGQQMLITDPKYTEALAESLGIYTGDCDDAEARKRVQRALRQRRNTSSKCDIAWEISQIVPGSQTCIDEWSTTQVLIKRPWWSFWRHDKLVTTRELGTVVIFVISQTSPSPLDVEKVNQVLDMIRPVGVVFRSRFLTAIQP